jgi:flagellar hook-length control protein FliK
VIGDPALALAPVDGHAAAAGGPGARAGQADGVAAAATAAGSVAARTPSPDTAPATGAADQVRAALDPSAPPAAGGGTVDGSPAYALTPAVAAPGGTATGVATTADVRPAQPALPPQAQVLNAVSPLLTTADGTHRLTVHLAPAHLGSVQVHLEVRGGEVTVRLTAVDPATGDALRQGTPELRSHLERIGLRSAGIDVQLAPGDPARDPASGGSATADRGSRDQDQRDHDQRDPAPWTGGDGSARGGDTARDGGWQRHGRPLEGWTGRGAAPARDAPAAPDPTDPLRTRPRDVRVDVRM